MPLECPSETSDFEFEDCYKFGNEYYYLRIDGNYVRAPLREHPFENQLYWYREADNSMVRMEESLVLPEAQAAYPASAYSPSRPHKLKSALSDPHGGSSKPPAAKGKPKRACFSDSESDPDIGSRKPPVATGKRKRDIFSDSDDD